MPTLVIVGAQWGDEAKGKIVDVLGSEADAVVRYSGGNNAGHTVIVGDEEFRFHLIPAGILHPGVTAILGGGMVVCPRSLLDELAEVRSRRSELGSLLISEAAHVVFPYHLALDKYEEEARGENSIGTTSRGIGPAYQDKVGRFGIRMGEFVRPERFRSRLAEVLAYKNRMIAMFGGQPFDLGMLYDEYSIYAEALEPFVRDTDRIVQEAVGAGRRVLFEGAQGTFLDLDSGTYPYVTSSHPVSGGACLGTGIGPRDIDSVLGVCKAYATRVGSGPFPTELDNDLGEAIRQKGKEYGTTTGRGRRCGWLDIELLRKAVRLNSMSGLVVTRLDVLSGFERLRVCTAYRYGQPLTKGEGSFEDAEPVFEVLPGWSEELTDARNWEDLPNAARAYLEFMSHHLGTPIAMVSVGPERAQTLRLRDDLLWG